MQPKDYIVAFAIGDDTSLDGDGSTITTRLHKDDLAAMIAALRVESPWLSAREAAEYLRCPLSRVRRLTMTRDLPHEKDGSRVLYHVDELDQYIRSGGAISPLAFM